MCSLLLLPSPPPHPPKLCYLTKHPFWALGGAILHIRGHLDSMAASMFCHTSLFLPRAIESQVAYLLANIIAMVNLLCARNPGRRDQIRCCEGSSVSLSTHLGFRRRLRDPRPGGSSQVPQQGAAAEAC